MVKVSKAGKARMKRMSSVDRKAIMKAAMLLADSELITSKRFEAIHRLNKSC